MFFALLQSSTIRTASRGPHHRVRLIAGLWFGASSLSLLVHPTPLRAETPLPPSLPPVDRPLTDLARYEGTEGARQYSNLARKLLLSKNYAGLEALAGWLRTEPFPYFTDGRPALDTFYRGLQPTDEELKNALGWSDWEHVYAEWAAARPGSPTLPVARGEGLIAFAWSIRGNGYANAVSKEAWEGFARELARARKVLEESTSPCPQRLAALQTVALGESWPELACEQLYEQALAAHPTYSVYYRRKAQRLLPRWAGRRGQMAAWATEETKRNRLGLGAATYAQIAFYALSFTDSNYAGALDQLGFTWTELRPSLEALVRRYPSSSTVTDQAIEWAWLQKDADAARQWIGLRLAKQFQGRLTYGELDQIKRWSNPSASAPTGLAWATSEATVSMGTGRRAWGYSLQLTADGAKAIVASLDGDLFLYSVPDLRLLKTGPREAGTKTALSADGSHLAVANTENGVSKVQEFDLDLTPLGEPISIPGQVQALVYTSADTFAIGTGGWKIPPKVLLVGRDRGITPTDWAKREPSHTANSDFTHTSDGRRLLAFTQPGGVSIRDLDSGQELAFTQIKAPGSPERLKFSPDGSRLAIISYQSDQVPVSLALWQGPDWAGTSPTVQAGPRGYGGQPVWSPDARWVASGGDSGSVLVWATSGGEPLRLGDALTWVECLAFTPDGQYLIGSTRDGRLSSWKIAAGAGVDAARSLPDHDDDAGQTKL